MKAVIKCRKCRFWDEGENNWGDCRRHAPGRAPGECYPPRTNSFDWCGEAEPHGVVDVVARESVEGNGHGGE